MLGLRPWEFARCTVREIEEMMAGYALRIEHQRDLAAWEVAYLMRASGNYPAGEAPTQSQLLGREPLPLDTRFQPTAEELAADGEWQRDLAIMQQRVGAGQGTLPRLSARELADAYAQAHVL